MNYDRVWYAEYSLEELQAAMYDTAQLPNHDAWNCVDDSRSAEGIAFTKIPQAALGELEFMRYDTGKGHKVNVFFYREYPDCSDVSCVLIEPDGNMGSYWESLGMEKVAERIYRLDCELIQVLEIDI